MDETEEILQLRASRSEVERIQDELDDARTEEAEIQRRKDTLTSQLKHARERRWEAIKEADAAKVPRARIAREVGMPRGNVYKLFDNNGNDS